MEKLNPKKVPNEAFKKKLAKLYCRFNFLNLAYTMCVILWGAYVRSSGSGAGCGAHWPLCNGEMIPSSNRLQTLIEFTHRFSSGVSLTLVLCGWLISRKLGEKKSPIRRVANLTLIAIILEALLGAGLVLFKLVEFDQSIARAISISLHLLNTLFLLASLVSLSFLSMDESAYATNDRDLVPKNRLFRATLLVFLFLGISGAIAALGDTLFKAPTLLEGMKQDLSVNAHFLIKLRVFHPLIASLWIFLGFIWSQKLLLHPNLFKIRGIFLSLLVLQFFLGFLNWVLLAPTVLQLIHLGVANLAFMAFFVSGLMWKKWVND